MACNRNCQNQPIIDMIFVKHFISTIVKQASGFNKIKHSNHSPTRKKYGKNQEKVSYRGIKYKLMIEVKWFSY